MKKKIGIYAASMGENAFGVGKQYLDLILQLGCVPRILTPDNPYEENIDLLLLQGGLDVNPSSFGEIPSYFTSNTDVFKQYVYDKCLPNYINEGKPVFGICLGFQQLMAYFGVKVTQHLPYHPQSSERWKKAHDAYPENNHILPTFKGKYDVNSFHHQGVLREDLNDEIIPLAYAENELDKSNRKIDIIEAFVHNTLPAGGVQWHPEDIGAWSIKAIVDSLLEQ